jgi:hypothetical protein
MGSLSATTLLVTSHAGMPRHESGKPLGPGVQRRLAGGVACWTRSHEDATSSAPGAAAHGELRCDVAARGCPNGGSASAHRHRLGAWPALDHTAGPLRPDLFRHACIRSPPHGPMDVRAYVRSGRTPCPASRKFPPPWRLSERTQAKISMKDIRVSPCMFLTRTASRRRRRPLVSGAPVGAASGIGVAIAQHSLMEQLQRAAAVSSALTCASTPGRSDNEELEIGRHGSALAYAKLQKTANCFPPPGTTP